MPTPAPVSTPTEVDVATVIDWMADPDAVTVLDVRSPAEFETTHIFGSYNLPLDLVGEHAAQLAARLDRLVVLVCQSGVRADQARQRLAGTGMDNLHVLKAGVPGYESAGGRVVNGRRRWGLDRQVRLIAGGLVLTSLVASRRAPQSSPARRRHRCRAHRFRAHRHLHHGPAALRTSLQPRNRSRRPAAARPVPPTEPRH